METGEIVIHLKNSIDKIEDWLDYLHDNQEEPDNIPEAIAEMYEAIEKAKKFIEALKKEIENEET